MNIFMKKKMRQIAFIRNFAEQQPPTSHPRTSTHKQTNTQTQDHTNAYI